MTIKITDLETRLDFALKRADKRRRVQEHAPKLLRAAKDMLLAWDEFMQGDDMNPATVCVRRLEGVIRKIEGK